jgi:hypothetical protein
LGLWLIPFNNVRSNSLLVNYYSLLRFLPLAIAWRDTVRYTKYHSTVLTVMDTIGSSSTSERREGRESTCRKHAGGRRQEPHRKGKRLCERTKTNKHNEAETDPRRSSSSSSSTTTTTVATTRTTNTNKNTKILQQQDQAVASASAPTPAGRPDHSQFTNYWLYSSDYSTVLQYSEPNIAEEHSRAHCRRYNTQYRPILFDHSERPNVL